MTHYWECRLKGRPAGTPKSTDPNKKKRKRVARQRDLCNFRIKITEYSPGANQLLGSEQQSIEENGEDFFFGAGDSFDGTNQPIGMIHPVTGLQSNLPGADGKKWYKIQRISDPAKEDGIPPVHKHTLEESDRVKKNSILLQIAKEEKGRKKNQVSIKFDYYSIGNLHALGFFILLHSPQRPTDGKKVRKMMEFIPLDAVLDMLFLQKYCSQDSLCP